jgi:hypothetical protein
VSTGFSDQHSSVEFTSRILVDGARLELAFHGCRPWVIPLYEPPIWGEMRESNSRDWSHNPVPKPFGQSRHKKLGAGRGESNTRRRGTSSLHFHCARPAKLLELARSLELRSGAYRAPALPVELYQRSWRGDSNADHGLTRPVLFLLSYTSAKTLEVAGRIALPMICFAGRCLAVLATPPHNLERKAGLEPALSFLACPEQLRKAKLSNGLATSRLSR